MLKRARKIPENESMRCEDTVADVRQLVTHTYSARGKLRSIRWCMISTEEVQLGRGQRGGFTTQDIYQYTKTFLHYRRIIYGVETQSRRGA